MKKILAALGLLLLLWLVAWRIAVGRTAPAPATAEAATLDPTLLTGVGIAPRAEALSFARYMRGDRPRLLLVSAFRDGRLSGIDVQQALPAASDDPVSVFNEYGYRLLQDLGGAEITIAAETLLLPFAGTASQIAAGVNYPAHGEEVSVRKSFLFPKQVMATAWNAGVPARRHLLDYELELGFVLLGAQRADAPPRHLGLVLAGDYTDRAELMRHMRLTDVSSGEGFTQGKSQPGSMPLGNLLVIPQDPERFYRALKLQLWRNGVLRQEAEPAQMTWDLQQILAESFAREAVRWTWNGEPVGLPLREGTIPARTVILSGTPGGVIFEPPTPRQLFVGLSETFFTLRWLQPQHVIEPFLREAYASGRYLQPGDEIVMRADRLGLIVNRIDSTE